MDGSVRKAVPVGALDARSAVVVLAVVAAAMALVAAYLWLRRRPPVPVDPSRFAQEPAEPWGTVMLAVFLLGPVIAAACRAIGLGSVVPAVLVGLVVLALVAAGVGRTVRTFSVGADGVDWRVLVRRRHAPLAEVVGVANPWDPSEAPRVWLTDAGRCGGSPVCGLVGGGCDGEPACRRGNDTQGAPDLGERSKMAIDLRICRAGPCRLVSLCPSSHVAPAGRSRDGAVGTGRPG